MTTGTPLAFSTPESCFTNSKPSITGMLKSQRIRSTRVFRQYGQSFSPVSRLEDRGEFDSSLTHRPFHNFSHHGGIVHNQSADVVHENCSFFPGRLVVALLFGSKDQNISLNVQSLALILRQSFALLLDPLNLGGRKVKEFKAIDPAAMPPDQGRHTIADNRLQLNRVTDG